MNSVVGFLNNRYLIAVVVGLFVFTMARRFLVR